jgi:hypothetical protein
MWLGNDLAVSTTQLAKLIGKYKSSINSSFQSIGFAPATMTGDCWEALTRAIPLIRDDPREARKWTLRQRLPPPATSFPEPEPTLEPSLVLPDSTPEWPLAEPWPEDEEGFLGSWGTL